MIYPHEINTKLFNLLKEKKDKLLNNLYVKEIDVGINKISNSNILNKSKNIIESIDLDRANSIINDIRNILNSFKLENKIEFRETVKNKIEEKIMSLYNELKPNLENLIKKACKGLIDKIINN